MNVKNAIKKIPGVKKAISVKKSTDFKRDRVFYIKNGFNPNKKNPKTIEYKIITELHKLEKGFGAKEMRPFGAQKVSQVISLIDELENKYGYSQSFAIDLATSALQEYKKLYEKKGWAGQNQYKQVSEFLESRKCNTPYGFGCETWNYNPKEILSANDYEKFLKTRKSTRAFSNQPISAEEIKAATKIAQNSPSACNRQPIKTYFVNSKKNKNLLIDILPGLTLFEMENVNLLLVTFDMSFALFAGERNQGWFNAGLFSMNLVNTLHSMGIGTCFLQYGERFETERKMKAEMGIPESERIAVAIACGHYNKTNKSLHSARKPIDEVFKEI